MNRKPLLWYRAGICGPRRRRKPAERGRQDRCREEPKSRSPRKSSDGLLRSPAIPTSSSRITSACPSNHLASWKRGGTKPTLTPLKKLATKLHRQVATFLLPAPPKQAPLQVQFRAIGPQFVRPLSPTERRYLRRARRQQEIIGWLSEELNEPPPDLPRHSPTDSPDAAGAGMRDRLNVDFPQQTKWESPSRAFDHWRAAVGGVGVTVFVYSLGRDSCNGFSLWHERAPVIAVSSAWREEARIFSLFHELGHLLLRGSSACLERVGQQRRDPIERWCEQFSASLLLPTGAIEAMILSKTGSAHPVRDLNVARAIARKARVSPPRQQHYA